MIIDYRISFLSPYLETYGFSIWNSDSNEPHIKRLGYLNLCIKSCLAIILLNLVCMSPIHMQQLSHTVLCIIGWESPEMNPTVECQDWPGIRFRLIKTTAGLLCRIRCSSCKIHPPSHSSCGTKIYGAHVIWSNFATSRLRFWFSELYILWEHGLYFATILRQERFLWLLHLDVCVCNHSWNQ